jgi:hypothetical protein
VLFTVCRMDIALGIDFANLFDGNHSFRVLASPAMRIDSRSCTKDHVSTGKTR